MKTPPELDRIADKVLAYRPKPQDKSGQAPEAKESICKASKERVIYIIPLTNCLRIPRPQYWHLRAFRSRR